MTTKSLHTPTGEALAPMGWTGKHAAIRKVLSGGAALVVRDSLLDTWVDDPSDWWTAHGQQVLTDDHEPAETWPITAYFVPSLWRSPDGRVVLMDENC
jgi:hypothetical protein